MKLIERSRGHMAEIRLGVARDLALLALVEKNRDDLQRILDVGTEEEISMCVAASDDAEGLS